MIIAKEKGSRRRGRGYRWWEAYDWEVKDGKLIVYVWGEGEQGWVIGTAEDVK